MKVDTPWHHNQSGGIHSPKAANVSRLVDDAARLNPDIGSHAISAIGWVVDSAAREDERVVVAEWTCQGGCTSHLSSPAPLCC
jgi:hypothetical protein